MQILQSEALEFNPPSASGFLRDISARSDDTTPQARQLLKSVIEETMEIWRDAWVGADWHHLAGQRRAYRNGYYLRKHWPTPLGLLEDVSVPRCRHPGMAKDMLARLASQQHVLADSAVEMLSAGVSISRIRQILEQMIQRQVSPAQVRRVTKHLQARLYALSASLREAECSDMPSSLARNYTQKCSDLGGKPLDSFDELCYEGL